MKKISNKWYDDHLAIDRAVHSFPTRRSSDLDPELVARYEARYQTFKQIYPALKPVFQLI